MLLAIIAFCCNIFGFHFREVFIIIYYAFLAVYRDKFAICRMNRKRLLNAPWESDR